MGLPTADTTAGMRIHNIPDFLSSSSLPIKTGVFGMCMLVWAQFGCVAELGDPLSEGQKDIEDAAMGAFLQTELDDSGLFCAPGETTLGIDVSKWQSTIDWSKVAADGVKFAFIRVSDGLEYDDPQFEQNWSGAKENGVIRGVYQFFRQDEDPVAQAQYLLDTMGPLEDGDLPPALDLETIDGQDQETILSLIHI